MTLSTTIKTLAFASILALAPSCRDIAGAVHLPVFLLLIIELEVHRFHIFCIVDGYNHPFAVGILIGRAHHSVRVVEAFFYLFAIGLDQHPYPLHERDKNADTRGVQAEEHQVLANRDLHHGQR